jgi:hypothetical protein
MIPEHRGINQSEAEIIRAALERASRAVLDETARAAIPNLEVVARCECGCASVDFDAPTSEQRSSVIADATGYTPRGGQVGSSCGADLTRSLGSRFTISGQAMTTSFCRCQHQ